MLATCADRLNLPEFIFLIIFGVKYKLRRSQLRSRLQPPVVSHLFSAYILLTNVRTQVQNRPNYSFAYSNLSFLILILISIFKESTEVQIYSPLSFYWYRL
jgi:hypothetical protein